MSFTAKRILVAGTSGDGGKTLVSLGLISAFRKRGLSVAAFKKGPDYIDAAWLGRAAGAEAANLDSWLMGDEVLRRSFAEKSAGMDVAVIEGNRGLYDGLDAAGTHSSAKVSRILDAPVLLVLDASKSTRTLAAIVLGCIKLEPETRIGGVVLNRVAGSRHKEVATRAIEDICDLPVIGAIPKLKDAGRIPGRHLGLVPVDEYGDIDGALDFAAEVIEDHLDLDKLLAIAAKVTPIKEVETADPPTESESDKIRIGVMRDGAFSFYYPENLSILRRHGAEVIPVRSMCDDRLPDIDALYIGGGFPETHAERLAGNDDLRRSIAAASAEGLPIFAECGGLMYLSKSISWKGVAYPMCGALPIHVGMSKHPIGHGYSELMVAQENPFFQGGVTLRGHEFHYSFVEPDFLGKDDGVFEVRRGTGLGNGYDGLLLNNTLALYTHLHALATPEWAKGMLEAARRHRKTLNLTG